MKPFFISLFLIISSNLIGQQLNEKSIIGKWKVINTQLMEEVEIGLDKEGKMMMEKFREGLTNTIFDFNSNGDFKIKFPENIPPFMEELKFLNNKKWKFNEGKFIVVGTDKDQYSLMKIFIRKIEGKVYFMLAETPILLEVKSFG